jgi:hypothetical protein
MADTAKALERGVEDRARGTAADVGDEADATRVAFVQRAVQLRPLFGSETRSRDPAYCD